MVNKVILQGMIVTEPESKTTTTGIDLLSFRFLVPKPYSSDGGRQDGSFYSVTAWRGLAKSMEGIFSKGDKVIVVGSIGENTWTDGKGDKRSQIAITLSERPHRTEAVQPKLAAETPPEDLPGAKDKPPVDSTDEDVSSTLSSTLSDDFDPFAEE